MLVLGIETSCDETAAAIVDSDKRILSHVILSQTEEHKPYGGVVPEIAARAHLDHAQRIIGQALEQAVKTLADMDAIAATGGPGLIGGVIVGVMTGKALASVACKPFIAVNHLEGHALTVRLTEDVSFPYLLLLVSGGHCQFLSVEGVGQYRLLGETMDDALGEAFDKTAKLLGLSYPGGPAVEALAREGDATAFDFPVPLRGREGCDFSFSGLKTAVRQAVSAQAKPLSRQLQADICASFQRAAADSITDRTRRAITIFHRLHPNAKALVVAGGVAANRYLREALEAIASESGMRLLAPPVKLCTDNGAMIAWAGLERLRLGLTDSLDFEPKARWPLQS